MRVAYWGVFILILLPIIPYAPSSLALVESDSKQQQGMLIIEVMPRFPYEYVGLVNSGDTPVLLSGWSISDGEGTWIIKEDLLLSPDDEVYVCSNITFTKAIHPFAIHIDTAEGVFKKGRIGLADDGDEIYLTDPEGRIRDVLAYGSSSYSLEGWTGDRCPTPPPGKALRRFENPLLDRNARDDWFHFTPGRKLMSPVESMAAVEPFLNPDDMRLRIIRELVFAQFSIECAVYELTDASIAYYLAEATKRGVRVSILIEGQPVGGMKPNTMKIVMPLLRLGCDVRILSSWHGFKRYDFLHCKYLIADGKRVLVGSENWATTSFEGNRGWGACIQSETIARFFQEIFYNDFDSKQLDINPVLVDNFLPIENIPISSELPIYENLPSFTSKVCAFTAPDSALASLLDIINNAKERLLIQMFYASMNWPDSKGPMHAVLEAAKRGVTVRILLDNNWYNNEKGGENARIVAELNSKAVEENIDLQAKLISSQHEFHTLHNKGLIADNKTLVSSINWVSSAFYNNREAALVIESREISDYYASAFKKDWIDDCIAPTILLPQNVTVKQDELIVIQADVNDVGGISRLAWDIGDDGSVEDNGSFLAIRLPVGDHSVRFTAWDKYDNCATCLIEIKVVSSNSFHLGFEIPVIMASAAIFFIIIARKRIKRN
ncbi:MAG: phospholipase D-like domain-containing protein [Methanomassiliicoccales archaeon]